MASTRHTNALGEKIPTQLKHIDALQLPLLERDCSSDRLHPSSVPSYLDPRSFYLTRREMVLLPPPLISVSEFVPGPIVELLMRRKKNSALGVKFISRGGFRTFGGTRPDEITNMEGALHTFVTPVIPRCEMTGDYRYNVALGGHGVSNFGDVNAVDGIQTKKVRLTRSVVMSASIQMDFEGVRIMMKVCSLDSEEQLGRDLLDDERWSIISVDDKHTSEKREVYDDSLRRHLIYHLTSERRLPARSAVTNLLDHHAAILLLEQIITASEDLSHRLRGSYARLHNDRVVSMEMLYNTALHQVRNEISALEAICPQGYVYTYDPASIFAQTIGAGMLNRLMLAALRSFSDSNVLSNMRVFAFNDYADRSIITLVSAAIVNQPSVLVLRKYQLFGGLHGLYDVTQYHQAAGAMLVVHNNSDGFGQNIETEGDFGSLDGAIGSNSSAAASLERERDDLLGFVF